MPHPDEAMCMRPTHINQFPAAQLVAAHESHDNDQLPNYNEIINVSNIDETNLMIDTPYYEDEKNEKSEKLWEELPSYEDSDKKDLRSSNKRAKSIANTCAILYGIIFLGAYFTYSNYTDCF
ncbi:hypothetical protein C6P42_003555 [Pichia californica]|nr:hypothetical protein C6P42_003555 [[Candida] californica]